MFHANIGKCHLSSSIMHTRITDGRCMDALTEAFLPDLRKNCYADAFIAYAKTTDMMLTHYEKEGTPYDPRTAFNTTALGIAALLAVAIFCLVRCFLIHKMRATSLPQQQRTPTSITRAFSSHRVTTTNHLARCAHHEEKNLLLLILRRRQPRQHGWEVLRTCFVYLSAR